MKSNMTKQQFVELYNNERAIYKAWGEYLKDYISKELEKRYLNLNKILKIPVSCRTKDVESLVEKAFYRDKKYKDPYYEITDKVGIRFVVMIEQQVAEIGNIIETSADWLDYSKDQDFNIFREMHPDVFTYQSRHYIVRNMNEMVIGEHTINKGTACEIQIRTLEQHAYAELSHDLFYKKQQLEDNKALRLLARTAAFNEESDELFGRMYKMVESKEHYYNDFMKSLKDSYDFSCESDKLNRTIYDDILILIEKYEINDELIIQYLSERPYILNLIKLKDDNVLFNQPIVLVLYYLLEKHGHELLEIWNFPEDVLDPIKADLGISME